MENSRETKYFSFGPGTLGWRQERTLDLVIAFCAEVGAMVSRSESARRLPLSVVVSADSQVRVLGIECLSPGEKQRLLDNLESTYGQVMGCRPC